MRMLQEEIAKNKPKSRVLSLPPCAIIPDAIPLLVFIMPLLPLNSEIWADFGHCCGKFLGDKEARP